MFLPRSIQKYLERESGRGRVGERERAEYACGGIYIIMELCDTI